MHEDFIESVFRDMNEARPNAREGVQRMRCLTPDGEPTEWRHCKRFNIGNDLGMQARSRPVKTRSGMMTLLTLRQHHIPCCAMLGARYCGDNLGLLPAVALWHLKHHRGSALSFNPLISIVNRIGTPAGTRSLFCSPASLFENGRVLFREANRSSIPFVLQPWQAAGTIRWSS